MSVGPFAGVFLCLHHISVAAVMGWLGAATPISFGSHTGVEFHWATAPVLPVIILVTGDNFNRKAQEPAVPYECDLDIRIESGWAIGCFLGKLAKGLFQREFEPPMLQVLPFKQITHISFSGIFEVIGASVTHPGAAPCASAGVAGAGVTGEAHVWVAQTSCHEKAAGGWIV